MTENSAGEPTSIAPWKPLNSKQRRVLGVLIEKAKTTPDVYPMTINGILTGANQKSNREPIMNLSADDVETILDELRGLGVVTQVQGSSRVAKYRHHAYEWFGLDKVESAVMTELLLRGEQTLGDLRARASRMEPIADQAALKVVVDRLVSRKLMIELTPAGRGQIVSHGVYKEREIVELSAHYKGYVAPSEGSSEDRPAPSAAPAASPSPRMAPSGITADMFAELSVDVAELRAEVARLREKVSVLENLLK